MTRNRPPARPNCTVWACMGGVVSMLGGQMRQRAGASVAPEPAQGAAEDVEARSPGAAAAADGGRSSLTEPLLGGTGGGPRRRAAESRELPWLLSSVAHLASALASFIDWLVRLFLRLIPGRAPQLSLLQQERLASLRERAALAYEAGNTEHQASALIACACDHSPRSTAPRQLPMHPRSPCAAAHCPRAPAAGQRRAFGTRHSASSVALLRSPAGGAAGAVGHRLPGQPLPRGRAPQAPQVEGDGVAG